MTTYGRCDPSKLSTFSSTCPQLVWQPTTTTFAERASLKNILSKPRSPKPVFTLTPSPYRNDP